MNLSALLAYISSGICGIFCVTYLVLTLIRQRGSLARWVFCGSMAILCFESLATGLSATAIRVDNFLYWQQIRLVALSFLPGSWVLFSLIYARGSNRQLLAKWRWTLIAGFAIPALLAIFYYDSSILFRQLRSEGGVIILLGWPGQATHFLMIIGAVLSMMNLERTYRAAVGAMRWQVKYMLLGLGTLFLVRFYTSSQALLFANVHTGMDTINSIGLIVSSLLILRALARSGHFDIEVYPSHAVLSNSLTVLLTGIYLLVVGVLAKLVALIGGDIAFPLKALGILVALVLLATLLQSDHFRLNVKQFVSRHFKRPMHDYRTVWNRFTEETSSHVRQPELCEALAKLIAETFDSLSVSLWLFNSDQSKLRLVASTSLSDTDTTVLELPSSQRDGLIQTLQGSRRPIDLDKSDEDWTEVLKEANPKKFPHGGNRIGIPMTARDSLLGVIVIGDRVSGAIFSEQEFDILNSVGTHAASSLLNLQLSTKLLETRELEAFQTMAAFFVHDLKNAASTLNIMVKNLPIHWDNPEFREDALRGISKTGERINQLIGRLSSVRNEMEIAARSTEVDNFAETICRNWQPPSGIELIHSFASKATAKIDSDQLGKVLLNLIINSAEAMEGGGRIEVATEIIGDHAILRVSDNGCGMSSDFMSKRLFRPFQTTKQRGLGIGMFQSKKIVEAHNGRFEVESEEGEGSTFRVLIPIDKED